MPERSLEQLITERALRRLWPRDPLPHPRWLWGGGPKSFYGALRSCMARPEAGLATILDLESARGRADGASLWDHASLYCALARRTLPVALTGATACGWLKPMRRTTDHRG